MKRRIQGIITSKCLTIKKIIMKVNVHAVNFAVDEISRLCSGENG
jgi:hypothetical protein